MTPTDFLRLAVAVIVLPPMIHVGRRFRGVAWVRYGGLALAGVYAAFVFTVLEDFVAAGLFNELQHLSLAASGVFALLAALSMRAASRQGGA